MRFLYFSKRGSSPLSRTIKKKPWNTFPGLFSAVFSYFLHF
nr:MAG TPA: hypothetical protein [Caudoviricetes sp.]